MRVQAVRNTGRRHGNTPIFQLHIAPLGNPQRVFDRARHMPEQFLHLLRRFEIELLCRVFELIGVIDVRSRPDTEQNIVGVCVFVLQVVDVIGTDDRQVKFPGDSDELLVTLNLLGQVVVLEFDVVVFAAEQIAIEAAGVPRRFVIVAQQMLVDLAAETGGRGDNAFVVLFQQCTVDTRFVVEAIYGRNRGEFKEVLVAVEIAGQQHHVIRSLIDSRLFRPMTTRRDIGLHPKDRFDTGVLAFRCKIRHAVHHAMVGERQRCHAHIGGVMHQRVEPIRAVQQAELGVAMQMHKIATVRHWVGRPQEKR